MGAPPIGVALKDAVGETSAYLQAEAAALKERGSLTARDLKSTVIYLTGAAVVSIPLLFAIVLLSISLLADLLGNTGATLAVIVVLAVAVALLARAAGRAFHRTTRLGKRS